MHIDTEPKEDFRPRTLKHRWRHIKHAIYGNVFIVGVLSLLWLLFRSGRKPSRLNYPCQKAAMTNVSVMFGGLTATTVAARLPSVFGRESARPWVRRLLKVGEVAALILLVVLASISLTNLFGGGGRPISEMQAAASTFRVKELRSTAADASNIYVAEGLPLQSERGVGTLIDVMDRNGLDFYKSNSSVPTSGPQGIIGSNDIVLLKVNGEWRYRGGTNTDVVKGVIDAIVHHPDGFTGEVVIVENGQWDSYMDNRPDNQNPSSCNAEDRAQSFNDVALMLAGEHKVSVYDWTAIQTLSVEEFGSGDARDGYVYVPEIEEGYPKFTTVYGTQISLGYGWWNGTSYDNSRVKFINMPVLKDHGGPGVTCSVKHFMGVQDLYKGTQDPPHGAMVNEGIFGKVMLHARYPDLNLVDAIWVTPAGGPNGPYERAVRVDKLIASTDPIAVDAYAGKYVLMPISGDPRHNPDGANQFNTMLSTTRDVLLAGGKQVTKDDSMMNVYMGEYLERNWAHDSIGVAEPAPTWYLAEGCTGGDFETWVLVQNPNNNAVNVDLTFMTSNGEVTGPQSVEIAANSRTTFEVKNYVTDFDVSTKVESAGGDIICERAVYGNGRTWAHDSIGVTNPAPTWYLAEGCTGDGFETWVLVQNPNNNPAEITLTYMTADGRVNGPTVELPANSRKTFFAADTVPGRWDVSTMVTSDMPVIAERAMYGNGRTWAHDSIGVTEPSPTWYLAEGCSGEGFETWVLVQNPNDNAVNVDLTFMTSNGEEAGPQSISIAGNSRQTFEVGKYVTDFNVSTEVESAGGDIICERAVYGNGRTWAHDSIGVTTPAPIWYLAEGCTGNGFETWVLVQNPNDNAVTVDITLMTDSGQEQPALLQGVSIPAGSRTSFNIGPYIQSQSYNVSTKVESSGGNVICERAMYGNAL